jgi:bacteriocin leader peptide (microcyclamide/patellamide family)
MEKNLMDASRKLMPQAAQPVNRITTGQLPTELAELSEEALQLHGDDLDDSSVLPALSEGVCFICYCSYDGDDAE